MWTSFLHRAVSLKVPQLSRNISVSSCCRGKKNFRKFVLTNRGNKLFKIAKAKGESVANYGPGPRGPREPFMKCPEGKSWFVPEMVPEIIVPDLTDCKFKPYVSYQAPDVIQQEFDAEQLFNAVYRLKIVEDFKAGKLGPDGEPLEPSAAEKLTATEASNNAKKTGSDIF